MRRIRRGRGRIIRRTAWGRWHWVGASIAILVVICIGVYLCRFSGLFR